MPTEQVTVRLDPEAARIYREASEEERQTLDLLMSLKLTYFRRGERRSFEQIMDDLSDQAEANGLTPEILDSILKEARAQ